MNHVIVYANTADDFESALSDIGVSGCYYENNNPFNVVFGYLVISNHTIRHKARNHPKLTVLPGANSPVDVTKHLNKSGIKGKTAYDIYAAIFKETNWDIFDPDL
jgi:hypothetical protein